MLSAVPSAVDAKDRHVVAAALAALHLSVESADDFLVSQFEVDPLLAAAGVRQQLARLQRSSRTRLSTSS